MAPLYTETTTKLAIANLYSTQLQILLTKMAPHYEDALKLICRFFKMLMIELVNLVQRCKIAKCVLIVRFARLSQLSSYCFCDGTRKSAFEDTSHQISLLSRQLRR